MTSHFTKADQGRALKEWNCSKDLLLRALVNIGEHDFGKAADELQDAIVSLRELQQMKDYKELQDKAIALLRKVDSNEQIR